MVDERCGEAERGEAAVVVAVLVEAAEVVVVAVPSAGTVNDSVPSLPMVDAGGADCASDSGELRSEDCVLPSFIDPTELPFEAALVTVELRCAASATASVLVALAGRAVGSTEIPAEAARSSVSHSWYSFDESA